MMKQVMHRVCGLAISISCTVLLMPSLASAHSGATGIVKDRMDAMSEMGDVMKVMGDMVKGKQPFQADAFKEGANVVKQNSPEIPSLFPQGSDGGHTEALPILWQEFDRFKTMAEQTTSEAETMSALVESGADKRALKRQFMKMGKSCKSCHTDYRKKK